MYNKTNDFTNDYLLFFVGVAVKEVLHNGRLRKAARKQNKREEQAY